MFLIKAHSSYSSISEASFQYDMLHVLALLPNCNTGTFKLKCPHGHKFLQACVSVVQSTSTFFSASPRLQIFRSSGNQMQTNIKTEEIWHTRQWDWQGPVRVSSAALRKFTCVEHEECERSAVVLVVVARRAPPLSPSVPTLRTADRLKSPAMSRAPPRRVKSPPLRNQQQPQQQQMYAAVPQGPTKPSTPVPVQSLRLQPAARLCQALVG